MKHVTLITQGAVNNREEAADRETSTACYRSLPEQGGKGTGYLYCGRKGKPTHS